MNLHPPKIHDGPSLSSQTETPEPLVHAVRGTQDWLPDDHAQLQTLESRILDQVRLAGYEQLQIPILEYSDLPERKSGAGITSQLYELAGDHQSFGRLCLRPELTAGIVRAYTNAEPEPATPWRVCHSGVVFRYDNPIPGAIYREFHQISVELLGSSGPSFDSELISLADSVVRELGLNEVTIRLGHTGLTRELFDSLALPGITRNALADMLSQFAMEGLSEPAFDRITDRLEDWLGQSRDEPTPPVTTVEDAPGLDRLFWTLVPRVIGRRTGHEILQRLQQKWEIGHTLLDELRRLQPRLRALSELRGPAPTVLEQIRRDYLDLMPRAVRTLEAVMARLEAYRIEPERLVLDASFSRGLGFYDGLIFELNAPGDFVIGAGGRYDGLARALGSSRDPRGAGFALGMERLWHALRIQEQSTEPRRPRDGVLVIAASHDDVSHRRAIAEVLQLRRRGVRTIFEEGWTNGQGRTRAEVLGVRVVAWIEAMPEHDLILEAETGSPADSLLDGLPPSPTISAHDRPTGRGSGRES